MDSRPFDFKKLDAWRIESTAGSGYTLTYIIHYPGLAALTTAQLSRYVNGITEACALEILMSLPNSTVRA